jgi:hypothetical protein
MPLLSTIKQFSGLTPQLKINLAIATLDAPTPINVTFTFSLSLPTTG